MASYLTYLDNQAYSSSGTAPDENFAREIMQLFSIGLWQLHDDGTQMLDGSGQPIPSYTQPDIVEQARVWTGFVQQETRNNVELRTNPWFTNAVDPMALVEEYRDLFPKMNLYSGYIGDAHPLCTDLPPRAFLRKGARYRFVGDAQRAEELRVNEPSNSKPDWAQVPIPPADNEPLFTPSDDGSALRAVLCNADPSTGRCSFESLVELGGNLDCHGIECTVDTVELVQINASGLFYLYEYIPPPCVSLAWWEDGQGKRAEDTSGANSYEPLLKLCLDPRAAAASAACCTAFRRSCYEHACSYVQERMTFDMAVGRCSAWHDDGPSNSSPPPPSPSPPPPLDGSSAPPNPPSPPSTTAWFLFPFDYMIGEDVACPAGTRGATEDECIEAAAAALIAGGEPHFNRLSIHDQGVRSKTNFPSGCNVNLYDATVLYNTHNSGKHSRTHKLVCANETFPPAADLSAASPYLCSRKRAMCNNNPAAGHGCKSDKTQLWWTAEACNMQVQVHVDGRVAIVDPGSTTAEPRAMLVQANSENWFRVRWTSGHHPIVSEGCADDCVSLGSTCLCDVAVTTSAVFTAPSNIPAAAEIEAQLHIGSAHPESYDASDYTECATAFCAAASPDVKVYTKGTPSAPIFDARTIFAVVVNATGVANGRTVYLLNKESTVTIGHGGNVAAYSFRNPPQFMKLYDPTSRDARCVRVCVILGGHLHLVPGTLTLEP